MQNYLREKEILSIGEASEYLGISIDTLRRWEKRDRITAHRSPGGHRYFKRAELDSLFGLKYTRDEDLLFSGSTINPSRETVSAVDPIKTEEIVVDEKPIPEEHYHYPTPPVDSPPSPVVTDYSYFSIPEVVIPKTENVIEVNETSQESMSVPAMPNTLPNVEAPISEAEKSSFIPKIEVAESITETNISENITNQVNLPTNSVIETHAEVKSVSFQDILKESKDTNTSPKYVKYIIWGIIIFTLIDLLFAIMWFNSS